MGQVETDALGRTLRVNAGRVFVVHPNGQGDVRCVPMKKKNIFSSKSPK
jgi:hypothetical protein